MLRRIQMIYLLKGNFIYSKTDMHLHLSLMAIKLLHPNDIFWKLLFK